MVKFQETNPEPGSGIVEWTQPNMNWNPWINQPMIIEGAEDYQVSDTQSCPSLVSLSGHAMDYRYLTTNQIKANSYFKLLFTPSSCCGVLSALFSFQFCCFCTCALCISQTNTEGDKRNSKCSQKMYSWVKLRVE